MDQRSGQSSPVHVGTSGWTYDVWNGPFYPPGIRGAERLAYYATHFDAVEINATFYRLPTEAMLAAWNRRLAPEFHLAVKGSRQITHLRKLHDCEEPLRLFWDRVRRLRALKVVLWQLPPSLHIDLPRLEAFLGLLPAAVRHAFEVRHESWWDDSVAALLASHGAAFVAVSHPRLPDTIQPTGDFLYLRFHGLGRRLYDYEYSHAELAAWARRLKPLLPGRELYAFFNNTDGAQAPGNARTFRALLQGQRATH